MTQFSAQAGMMIRRLVFILTIVGALAAAGCGSKEVKNDEGNVPNAVQADENASGDSDSGKALGLQTVHFPYDAFQLNGEAKQILGANATILKEHATAKIQVEGHCDQRGGIQYNIALGEKRANATKKYLVDQGIADERITTISFGKERPVDQGTNDEAYAKNRRANFVITSK